MIKRFHVYIMTNRRDGVLYVGVTSDLARRISDHRLGAAEGFTKRYNLHRFVWLEEHPTAEDAIKREKQLKAWNRAWKIQLIEAGNPDWEDLFERMLV